MTDGDGTGSRMRGLRALMRTISIDVSPENGASTFVMSRLSHVLLATLLATAASAQAGDMPEFSLVIKNHQFEPAELKVPANTRFKILVTNQDTTPSEFESTDFNREKIVLPSRTISVFVGPLDKGSYKFFDDFHQDTGKGVLIVE